MSAVENHSQEMLQIPEGSWIGKGLTLSEVICKVDGMLQSLENACEAEGLNDEAFFAQVSGSLSFESIRGLTFKGIIVKGEINDFCVTEKNILRGHPDIELKLPVRPQFSHKKSFNSKKEEEEFFCQVEKIGCLMPNVKDVEASCTCYRSTVKYWFIPQASLFIDDHHLIVSDDALSCLKEIDELISVGVEDNVLENRCKCFLEDFGSHSFQGTLHFGGIYICLCYTLDCSKFESEDIERLQNEAIDSQLCMYFNPCYKATRVSQIKCISGDPNLKKQTYIQVITSGGPDKTIGFPDWKNCLFASNKLWKMIDCGLTHKAVWDIILLNHRKCLKNAEKLAIGIKQCWSKIFLSSVPKALEHINKRAPLDYNTLERLVTERSEFERIHLDPCAWGSHYVPHLEEYLCSAIEKCDDIKVKMLRSVIEPLDTGLLCSAEALVKKIYDSSMTPPLKYKDFMRISQHFRSALSLINSEEFIKCPSASMQAVSIVEKTVNLVCKHLQNAGQKQELCWLLTVLLPLQYNQTSERFSAPLTYIDIEYLNTHFDELMQLYFEFCSEYEEHKNSFIFYLIVHISNIVEMNEECVQSHIDFVQNELKVDTNIESARETYILFKRLGLHFKYPQVLSRRDAIQIREDTLQGGLLKSLSNKPCYSTPIRSESIVVENISQNSQNMNDFGDDMQAHYHQHAKTCSGNTSGSVELPRVYSKSCTSIQAPTNQLKSTAENNLQRAKWHSTPSIVVAELEIPKSRVCSKSCISIQAHDGPTYHISTAENDETNHGSLQRAKWNSAPSIFFVELPQSLPTATDIEEICCDVTTYNDPTGPVVCNQKSTRKYHSSQDEKASGITSPMSPIYIMLQKIMSFDSKCRIEFGGEEDSDSEDDSDSDSENCSNSIHPLDSLLALIHCSDNFLRQDLFCRLATCQIAVPLLLPHPITKQPTLLLWAMRSIVKEFKLASGKVYHGQIMRYQAPFVSFLRLGKHSLTVL